MEIRNPNGQIIRPVKWRLNKNGKMPYQGQFVPGNRQKYQGDPDTVVFRSGMELRLFKHMDESPNVVGWSSERTYIPYVSPKDGKLHKYIVDVRATVVGKDAVQRTFLIEVKEFSQTKPPNPPKPGKKPTARYLREALTYEVNSAKWAAAEKVCEKKGWTFLIMTNKDLRY